MNLLNRIRRRNRPLGRLIISAFFVVWLNMALQPCLMAAAPLIGEADPDCPHCPEPVSHCDDASARCTWVDAYDYDGRQGAADPYGDGVWLSPVLNPAAEPRVSAKAAPPRPPPEPPPSDTPLHLVYCVQLK
jgi:hypothetical protein